MQKPYNRLAAAFYTLETATATSYANGQLHREDGPAVEWADGTKMWFQNGKLHRDGAPAVELADGGQEWHRHGKLHREDGPAMIAGTMQDKFSIAHGWFVNGLRHRLDGPALEFTDGTKAWYRDNLRHRDDGPAVEGGPDGDKQWYRHGKLHRSAGAAFELASGTKAWYHDGAQHRNDGPAEVLATGDESWVLRGEEMTQSQFQGRIAAEKAAIAQALEKGSPKPVAAPRTARFRR